MIEKLFLLLPLGGVVSVVGTAVVLQDVVADAPIPTWFVGLLLAALGWLIERRARDMRAALTGIDKRINKLGDRINKLAEDVAALGATVDLIKGE